MLGCAAFVVGGAAAALLTAHQLRGSVAGHAAIGILSLYDVAASLRIDRKSVNLIMQVSPRGRGSQGRLDGGRSNGSHVCLTLALP